LPAPKNKEKSMNPINKTLIRLIISLLNFV